MADMRQMERTLVALELSLQMLMKHVSADMASGRRVCHGAKLEAVAAAITRQSADSNLKDGLAAEVERIFGGVGSL